MEEAPQIHPLHSKRSSLPSFSSKEISSSPSVSVRRQSFQTQLSEASSERKKGNPPGMKRTWSTDSVKSDSEDFNHPTGKPQREGFQMSINTHPYQIVSSSSAVLSRGNPTATKRSWVPSHRPSKSLSSLPPDPSHRPRPLPTPPHATLPAPLPTAVHAQTLPCPSDQAEELGVRDLTRRWEERGSSASEAEEIRPSDGLQSKRRSRSLDEQVDLKDQSSRTTALSPRKTPTDEVYDMLPPSPPVSISSLSDLGSPPLVSTPPVLTADPQSSLYSTLSRSTNRTRPKRSSKSFANRLSTGSNCDSGDSGDSDDSDEGAKLFRRNITARPLKTLVTSLMADSVESKKGEQDRTAQDLNEVREETEYRHIIQGLIARVETLERKLSNLELMSMAAPVSSDSELCSSSAFRDVLSPTTTATSHIPGLSTSPRVASATKDRSDRKQEKSTYARDVPGYLILVSIGVSIFTWEVFWGKFIRGRA